MSVVWEWWHIVLLFSDSEYSGFTPSTPCDLSSSACLLFPHVCVQERFMLVWLSLQQGRQSDPVSAVCSCVCECVCVGGVSVC